MMNLDVRILQIYSYYQASRLYRGSSTPPTRRGFFTIICWLLIFGWWLALLLTIVSWVFMISGVGAHIGMRLLGLVPIAGFLGAPDEQYEASTIGVASSLAEGSSEQLHPGSRLAYTLLLGWWMSALLMLAAWLMLITVIGIPLSRRFYGHAPLLATLAKYAQSAAGSIDISHVRDERNEVF